MSEKGKIMVEKLKPELKRFQLKDDQITGIVLVIKEKFEYLDDCIKYLKSIPNDTDGEEISEHIIDICYPDEEE